MLLHLAIACLCCLGPILAQEQQQPPPQRELSEREIARRGAREIQRVANEGEAGQILATLREVGLLDDTDVVRAVGKLVDDEREPVRWAAVITLRYNPSSKASSELIAAARDKEIRADNALFAEVIRGIGQHQDARALPLLAEGFGPKQEADPITDARIDAVGRIRNADAVNTLIKYARSGFQKGHEDRIATALQGQTGEDLGNKLRPWVLWWNQAKVGYREPETPPAGSAKWREIWEQPSPERMFDRIPGQDHGHTDPQGQDTPTREAPHDG